MDPLSAILLIGIFTVATVKTGSAAVNDGIASAQGKTPPSQERWRANQEKRRERGEKPRKDPGGIRRIWGNQMEFLAEKSAHKHQGKLEYLDRNGADIATGKRERMEAADRRRQLVGSKLARTGGSSWEAMKTAAQKAADAKRNHDERKTEQAAWRENERRDTDTDGWVDADGRGHPRQYRSENQSGWELPVVYGEDGNPYCVHPDGSWSPYESVPIEVEDAVADGPEIPNAEGNGDATVLPFDRQSTRERHDTARGDGAQEREDRGVDPEHDRVGDPDRPGSSVTVAELQRRRSEQSRARQRRHEAEQAQADRDHAERMAGVHPDSTNTDQEQHSEDDAENAPNTEPDSTDTSNNTEGTSMTQHSGEITNLSDALDYVRSASEYCEQLYGQFETSLSQAHSAADDIGNEASGMETAISSLTGFELTNEAGRLAGVQEHYNSIVQAMNDVETAISAAREALSSAQSDFDESAEEFQAQTGISEQASSHDEVANDMGFYVNA